MSCPICQEVLYEPYVGRCGHSVCLYCFIQLRPKKCPVCREISDFKTYPKFYGWFRKQKAYAQRAEEWKDSLSVAVAYLAFNHSGFHFIESTFPDEKRVIQILEIVCEHPEEMGTFLKTLPGTMIRTTEDCGPLSIYGPIWYVMFVCHSSNFVYFEKNPNLQE